MRWIMLLMLPWLAAAPPAVAGLFSPPDWPELKRDIRRAHPRVPQVTIAQFQQRLAQGERPILLDVRSPAEFAVSHLAGARLAPDLKTALALLANQPKDSVVLLYCSVGMRSSALAAQLLEAGYTRAENLEGSLFEWANQDGPVFRGERQVRQVHPYDRKWGQLLRADLRAYSPGDTPRR